MKPSEVYTKAAELIFNRTSPFCCWAIKIVAGREESLSRDKNEKLFHKYYRHPSVNGNYPYFGFNFRSKTHYELRANRNHRITALLLLAEICKEME